MTADVQQLGFERGAVYDEQELFGAPPGHLTGITLAIGLVDDQCPLASVVFHGHMSMRNRLATLRVNTADNNEIPTIVGALTPVLLKAHRMNVSAFRRHLWAIHNRLGKMGYEVELKNCGREPKH